MIYPKAWDVTPITLNTITKTYDGMSVDSSQVLYVRMQYGYTKIVGKDGVGIDCNGLFYKQGSLPLAVGDKISYDSKSFEVVKKREFRLENGNIEYTKVWFK